AISLPWRDTWPISRIAAKNASLGRWPSRFSQRCNISRLTLAEPALLSRFHAFASSSAGAVLYILLGRSGNIRGFAAGYRLSAAYDHTDGTNLAQARRFQVPATRGTVRARVFGAVTGKC